MSFTPPTRLKNFISSSWMIAGYLLILFLITTPYKFAWDDQSLELPLLKRLIDPTLYPGDYFVDGLVKNFSSFLYPILAKFITISQIPCVYFVLYIIVRYFLFFWMYKIWHELSKEKITAFACVFSMFAVLRIGEFFYRTFSHQEFALAFVFAAIYCFIKNRFFLASLILGIAANFHGLYSLFVMFFVGVYLMFSIRKHGFKKLFLSPAIFCIGALPFFIWAIKTHLTSPAATLDQNILPWPKLFYLSCPQNFFFPFSPFIKFSAFFKEPLLFLHGFEQYIFLLLLTTILLCFLPAFRSNRHIQLSCAGAWFMLLLCFLFTYVHPSRTALNLNLFRNTQFLNFFLTGFFVIFFKRAIEEKPIHCWILVLFSLFILKFKSPISLCALSAVFFAFTANSMKEKETFFKKIIFWGSAGLSLLWLAATCILIEHYIRTEMITSLQKPFVYIATGLTFLVYIVFIVSKTSSVKYSRLIFIFPLCLIFCQSIVFRIYRGHIETSGENFFWDLQNAWEEVQLATKNKTPPDALLLVPHNMAMGGFRSLSERSVIASSRDKDIIGFDYAAAEEWAKRIAVIRPFAVEADYSFDEILQVVQSAIFNYNVTHIVFMTHAFNTSYEEFIELLYHNKYFVLGRVNRQKALTFFLRRY